MNPLDLLHCWLGGLLSFLTPEALALFPLLFAAAGARGRSGAIAATIGLGLAMQAAGFLAQWAGQTFGLDASWLRRGLCVLLVCHGLVLTLGGPLAQRFSALTGETRGTQFRPPGVSLPELLRLILLTSVLGAIWIPKLTPALAKASAMAAESQGVDMALGGLFAFGLGAAVPWVALGRLIRIPARPLAESVRGKRLLGLALVAAATVALTGADTTMVRLIDARLPAAAMALPVRF